MPSKTLAPLKRAPRIETEEDSRWRTRLSYGHADLRDGTADVTVRARILILWVTEYPRVDRRQAMLCIRAAILADSTWSVTGIPWNHAYLSQRAAHLPLAARFSVQARHVRWG